MSRLFPLLFLLTLSTTVQSQTKNPFQKLSTYKDPATYTAEVASEGCAYQVMLNDIPLYQSNGKLDNNVKFLINPAILKSGKQRLSFKLLPKAGLKVLPQNSSFKITINLTGGNPATVLSFSPGKPVAGKAVFEDAIDFQASVPYDLKGWSASNPLKATDEALRKETILYYRHMLELIRAKKGQAFMDRLLKAGNLIYQTTYLTPGQALQQHQEWAEFINKGAQVEPLGAFELEAVGNGRAVRLSTTGPDKRGEGVIRFHYKSGTQQRIIVFDLLLHKPLGSDKLEAIWFLMQDKPIEQQR